MTLVSIVGDFYSSVLPLFYEFQTEIKKHVIIYDDARSDTLMAQKIYKGTKRYITEKNLLIQTYLLKIDEDSQHDLNAIVDSILAINENSNEIFINATDGLANIALFLSQKLLNKGSKFISYDRYDNSYNLLDANGMASYKIKNSMKIKEHFLLKEIEIVSESNKEEAQMLEVELINLFEGCEGDRTLYAKHFQGNKKIAKTQTGFLYEYYIYNLIKELNFDDIALGVKVLDRYTQTNEIVNEFDIIIMKENHLHMIECKYQDLRETKGQFLYKLDSIRTTLDDDSRLMLLSNEALYNEEKQNPYFAPNAIHKRAHNKKIYLRGSPVENTEIFIKEIDAIFGLHTQEIDTIIKKKPKPIKKIDKGHQQQLQELVAYLKTTFCLDIAYLEKKELLKLLNYKMNYTTNVIVVKNMKNEKMRELIRMLNRVDNFQKGLRLEEALQYFKNNF